MSATNILPKKYIVTIIHGNEELADFLAHSSVEDPQLGTIDKALYKLIQAGLWVDG